MKIKRFLAPDMRQAIRRVRKEQGPDAVILSNRQVDGGVEIISAIDFDESQITEMAHESPTPMPRPDPPPPETMTHPANASVTSRPTAPIPAAPPGSNESLDPMRCELHRLRSVLEDQLQHLGKAEHASIATTLATRLKQIGFGDGLIEEVLKEVREIAPSPELAWTAACKLLAQRIAVIKDDVVHQGGVMALIGPTGVGKTTTVAKLATRFALRFGRRHLALITTDTYRMGAQEQLLTFSEMLGVPVQTASSREELGRVLREHARKKLVLIDNAGLSQRDLRLAAQLGDLSRIPFVKTYLVVSATTQAAGLDEIFSAFGRTKLQGCILTKLDETASLRPVVETLLRRRIPLVYACDGQRIPEDIHTGIAATLVERADKLAADFTSGQANPFAESKAANGLA